MRTLKIREYCSKCHDTKIFAGKQVVRTEKGDLGVVLKCRKCKNPRLFITHVGEGDETK